MLTHSQKRVLDYFAAHIDQNGYAPTYRQAAKALGYSGWGQISRTVECLVERGFLDKLWGEVLLVRRTRYFVFDDQSKSLVPWQLPVRKAS